MSAHRRAPRTGETRAERPARARGRRRRPSLLRRLMRSLPLLVPGRRRIARLEAEARELRRTVEALRAELALRSLLEGEPVETTRTTMLLPLVKAAVSAEEEWVPLDVSPDTAVSRIVLADLPEARLLDPRVDRDPDPLDGFAGLPTSRLAVSSSRPEQAVA